MTRPDARLLVPVASLPGGRAPEGARRVLRCDVCVEPQAHYSGCDAPDAGDHCTTANDCAGRAAWYLDLSRPDVVDGVPVRLDVLGWALGVLGWYNPPGPSLSFGWAGGGAPVWPSRDDAARVPDVDALDLSGLSDDDASRAVVAAALRGGA